MSFWWCPELPWIFSYFIPFGLSAVHLDIFRSKRSQFNLAQWNPGLHPMKNCVTKRWKLQYCLSLLFLFTSFKVNSWELKLGESMVNKKFQLLEFPNRGVSSYQAYRMLAPLQLQPKLLFESSWGLRENTCLCWRFRRSTSTSTGCRRRTTLFGWRSSWTFLQKYYERNWLRWEAQLPENGLQLRKTFPNNYQRVLWEVLQ